MRELGLGAGMSTELLLDDAATESRRGRLSPVVEELVADAIQTRSWVTLSAATLALRVLERQAAEQGQPVPERVTQLLALALDRASRRGRMEGR